MEVGTNELVGMDPERIREAALRALSNGRVNAARPELWDGRAALRIANVLREKFA